MRDRLNGTVIVTGASRGIGASIAAELAMAGFSVVCLSRSGELPHVTDLDGEARRRMMAIRCDITDAPAVHAAFSSVPKASGQAVVGLVNNAGIHLQGPSATFALEDFERVMFTNATSVLLASQAAYPLLCNAGASLIVNIGSFYDKLGVKGNAAYCASKAAVGALSRCLAVEWARQGIRVVNVAPGYIETDLNRDELNEGALKSFLKKRIPLGGPGKADDIGRFVAGLFQLPSAFVTGETFYVDGGQGIAL
ncbi:SDR family oxidoreductase [Burkholderia multivorans]|uniref:SDR family NAD(P)-dependent oxidoreductase n=1 Tax=Burkholderia multivorans TaxID=87883 RepID=UPI002018C9A2|nr:SDR family oxidoreductase [Burkholderia multivorans]UQN71442.1 SDR family oxidoreductase [Burkholderia multivorans]UQN76767.1 SDR family oxidoreductase [Burkholderia multivorans]